MATINPDFQPTNIQQALKALPFTDPKTGTLTEYGQQTLEALRSYVNGTSRLIPCSAGGLNVNLIELTPNPVRPLIERYVSYDTFVFRAAHTSTGAVTATVVPETGALATLKVYKSNGASQAGAGDVVADSVYMAIFSDFLDAGAGGFVLK